MSVHRVAEEDIIFKKLDWCVHADGRTGEIRHVYITKAKVRVHFENTGDLEDVHVNKLSKISNTPVPKRQKPKVNFKVNDWCVHADGRMCNIRHVYTTKPKAWVHFVNAGDLKDVDISKLTKPNFKINDWCVHTDGRTGKGNIRHVYIEKPKVQVHFINSGDLKDVDINRLRKISKA